MKTIFTTNHHEPSRKIGRVRTKLSCFSCGLWLIIFIFVLSVIIISCKTTTSNKIEQQNTRTTSSIRLSDIESQIKENPVTALSLVYIYKEVYSVTNDYEKDDWRLLALYEKQAAENLLAMQEKAIEEERWDDVISLGRSISSIGIITAHSGKEAEFTLAYAKKKLSEGDNLSAFLAAVRAHELQPMDQISALLFLEKAVEARQRRSSAFFLAAAQAAGARNISPSYLEYATGRDTPTDMIKGVATVIVDRGFRVERGMGIPDVISGSAFFIDSSGLMITNYHVIASEVDPRYRGYSRLYIRMGDASSPRIPARVIGWDKALDLALIKTEIETEYVFSIVDRVVPRVGDTVLAIGSPLGLEKTVTSGIVSALGRRFLQIGDVYQIDAAINAGNSGGPIVDSEGRLVGIAFAGIAYHHGLNFAIPAQQLASALPAMIKGGRAPRPWLGFSLCETFSGAEIIYTAPNTPASELGIKEGLFIRTINGKTITSPQGRLISDIQMEVFPRGPGELVLLETIDREGNIKKNIMMTVMRPDIPLLDAAKIDMRERIVTPLFGMVLTPLPSTIFSSNFRVNRVIRGSIADSAGISEDDPVSINRLRIMENEGVALLEISIRKRRMGYLDTRMQLPAWLDSPDLL
ncbi:MAG: trypsin-like peptidase domain-containing protein [Treponema sp.]|nr:trypsin-like peptidase domain-containing protein [Treponema sp.]